MVVKIIIILFCYQCSFCWTYDFNCLFNKCETGDPDRPPDSSTSNYLKYNPYCLMFDCGQKKDSENPVTESKLNWNPSCWFKDCSQNAETAQKPLPKFWNRDYWSSSENEGSKSWKDKLYCIFKHCPEEIKEEDTVKSKFSFRSMYNSAINYLNAAKPQQFVVDNVFSSELNPYCWFTECCNDNSLPGNIEKLSNLFNTRLYGQHLANTVLDAIGSHWDSKHLPRKALVLSFHGAVGTGKNYVSEMIANSLFKLGVKSKYVHHFSGRIHFTVQGNSESYKQNLYLWLKGNVTSCTKQLFIFDEADHMPEQVLNSILPMLDYREKVDGADYRNSIFVFLSNAGSELILTSLVDLYNHNKTREEIEISDFETVIVKDIFNKQGGFYHSDTISHNLIDHYIPFLPMERQHVEECIMDQFRGRNVASPSEDHVGAILNSILWGKTEHFVYAKSGCKSVGSQVSLLYEKYYKPKKEKKSDL